MPRERPKKKEKKKKKKKKKKKRAGHFRSDTFKKKIKNKKWALHEQQEHWIQEMWDQDPTDIDSRSLLGTLPVCYLYIFVPLFSSIMWDEGHPVMVRVKYSRRCIPSTPWGVMHRGKGVRLPHMGSPPGKALGTRALWVPRTPGPVASDMWLIVSDMWLGNKTWMVPFKLGHLPPTKCFKNKPSRQW